jgi:raffinose/stachyose/melibiose transport system substrate-binding protein
MVGLLALFGLLALAQSKKIVYLANGDHTTGRHAQFEKMVAECNAQTGAGIAYEPQDIQQAELRQKLQLLAASNSLPTIFPVDEPSFVGQLHKNGQVADLEEVFKKLGILDKVSPAALVLQKNIGGGKFLSLPLELNIEGIWYNKKLFAAQGLKVPLTFDQMMAAAEKFKAAGIQPFAASGEQKWPLTRLLNGYVARKFGADAMARVAAGELKVTEPGFIEAARAIQDMGKKGYFGAGVNTIDYTTALQTFMSGKAAMFYMGSWALGDFNNPANKIDAETVGFFNFPVVRGGKGSINDWSLNTGIGVVLNAKYDASIEPVLKCVMNTWGDRSMAERGAISGFKVARLPAGLPALTKDTLQRLSTAKAGYLWFEGKMSAKAAAVATDNVQLLVTGDITPENYMAELQRALP